MARATLAGELQAGHPVSERIELGYSLQANRKTWKAPSMPTAMRSSSTSTGGYAARLRQPIVSVDTKCTQRWPRVASEGATGAGPFVDKTLGKAIPYGIYDVNTGWVSVGEDHDTAVFAVETLRRWG